MKSFGGRRQKAAKVKTAKGRSTSSQKWLARQLNDPYVAEAKRQGWRSRAAFKLADLDERFKILKKGGRVLDLGAAPGGWTQVAVERGARVVAVDILEMAPVAGAEVLRLDFLDWPRRKRSGRRSAGRSTSSCRTWRRRRRAMRRQTT